MLLKPAIAAELVNPCCTAMSEAFGCGLVVSHKGQLWIRGLDEVEDEDLWEMDYCPWCGRQVEITECE